MVTINHDWDTSDPEQQLEIAVREYMNACYAGKSLDSIQIKEVRQAFLSGIHWLNTLGDYCPDEIQEACRKLTGVGVVS